MTSDELYEDGELNACCFNCAHINKKWYGKCISHTI